MLPSIPDTIAIATVEAVASLSGKNASSLSCEVLEKIQPIPKMFSFWSLDLIARLLHFLLIENVIQMLHLGDSSSWSHYETRLQLFGDFLGKVFELAA